MTDARWIAATMAAVTVVIAAPALAGGDDVANVPRRETLPRVLEDLERRIRALETATPLRSASIGEGGLRIYGGGDLTIEDGGSIDVVYPDSEVVAATIGDIFSVATDEYTGTGLLVQDTDADDVAVIKGDVPAGESTIRLYDHDGTQVLQTDRSGKGLARPNVHYSLHRVDQGSFDTGSTSFTTAYHGFANLWSPRLVLRFSTGSNAGSARLLVEGNVIGTANWSSSQTLTIDADIPASVNVGETIFIEFQVRADSGASPISVVMFMLRGGAT